VFNHETQDLPRAVGFLVLVNLSLLTGSVLIGILAFVSRPTDEELVREIHDSVKEFVEEYLPAEWPRGALDSYGTFSMQR
jgi:hypothetical protein